MGQEIYGGPKEKKLNRYDRAARRSLYKTYKDKPPRQFRGNILRPDHFEVARQTMPRVDPRHHGRQRRLNQARLLNI